MSAPSVCDICDAHPDVVRPLAPVFTDYGGARAFHGAIRTVKCFEDNSKVKALVEGPGHGAVLVVDGGGSLRRSLFGGNLAAAAAKNGWAGVVVDGAVRDLAELAAEQIGIKARGVFPVKTDKQDQGLVDVAIEVGGQTLLPGEYLYADADGMIVVPHALHRP